MQVLLLLLNNGYRDRYLQIHLFITNTYIYTDKIIQCMYCFK